MHKIIYLVLVLGMSLSSWSKSLDAQAFETLSGQQKVEVLKAYHIFFRQLKIEDLPAEKKASLFKSLNLIGLAHADGNYDCFYAGWPSRRVGGKCTHPSRGNSAYSSQSSGCRSNQLLCQPVLFGDNLCANVITQSQRNNAYAQCESIFQSSGRSLSSVAQSLNTPELAGAANEVFSSVETICRTGFQASFDMCRNLRARVEEIRSGMTTVQSETPPEENARPSVEVDAEVPTVTEITPPREETTPPPREVTRPSPGETELVEAARRATQINEVVAEVGSVHGCPPESVIRHHRIVLEPDPAVPVLVCAPASESHAHTLTPAETAALIRDYNITFHPSNAVANSAYFHSFVHEMNKFPRGLMREMAAEGGEIRLIVGEAVTSDPRWDQDRQRLVDRRLEYERYHRNRGVTGPLPGMTVEQINHSFNTTIEGARTWDYVSGAGGSFSDRNHIMPTRVVINQLYQARFRNPDGSVTNRMQGSTNLFLHEHGHALDNLYGHHTISDSAPWQAAMGDARSAAYVRKIFSSYETYHEGEGFAELFAYYHGCGAARTQMETHAPALANFFRNLTSMEQFRPANRRRPADTRRERPTPRPSQTGSLWERIFGSRQQ